MDTYRDTEQRVIGLIKKNLFIDVSGTEHLNCDSYEFMQLMVDFEEEFDIRFMADDIKKMASNMTLECLVAVIDRRRQTT